MSIIFNGLQKIYIHSERGIHSGEYDFKGLKARQAGTAQSLVVQHKAVPVIVSAN